MENPKESHLRFDSMHVAEYYQLNGKDREARGIVDSRAGPHFTRIVSYRCECEKNKNHNA